MRKWGSARRQCSHLGLCFSYAERHYDNDNKNPWMDAMTVVKGTRPRRLRVVEYRPHLRVWLSLSLLALFIGGVQTAFWFGYKNGMAGQESAIQDAKAIRIELDSARAAEVELRRAVETAKLGAEVDQKSLEEVRLQVLELKSNIAELEEENQFYRNLMVPSGKTQGLNFGTVELAETDKSRHYRFKIVMQQLTTSHQLLNGTLNVNVVGRRAGEITVLPLSDLSAEIPSANIKLRFKYFQNIEGELILPDDFEPERIDMEARSTGKKATSIEKRFGWLVRTND